MIIRLKSREKRRSKGKKSSSGTTSTSRDGSWCTLRVAVYFVAFVGTIYLVTGRHGLDDHFTRIAAETILHLPQHVMQVAGASKDQQQPQPPPNPNPNANSNTTTTATTTTTREPTTEQSDGKHPSVIPARIKDSLFQVGRGITAEAVWNSLLQEGEALLKASSSSSSSSSKKDLVAIEVGMHRAHQCVQAATAGLTAHCLEPSPQNFERVQGALNKSPPNIQNRIKLYQMAAGATSGMMLNFSASGGTGDHVGEFDSWNMKVGKTTDKDVAAKAGAVVQVQSIAVDDIIATALEKNPDDNIFVAKIDTQGFEPSVFAGLDASVFQRPRIDYILFEYWPKGMDLLASTGEQGSDVTRKCIAADLLERLQKAGYTLYALPNTSHPSAPREARVAVRDERHAPLENPKINCDYYYQLEERFPSPTYKMGYWSDFLAVSPNASLPALPVTGVGKELQQQRQ